MPLSKFDARVKLHDPRMGPCRHAHKICMDQQDSRASYTEEVTLKAQERNSETHACEHGLDLSNPYSAKAEILTCITLLDFMQNRK